MYAASREALAHTRSALQSALGSGAATAAAAQAGSELFSVVEALDNQRALRSALADASAPVAVRVTLAEQVFGGKVSASTLATVKAAAGQDWSAQSDLTNSLVQLGREALLKAAADQNQLDTVEDELFRLGRIVAGNPDLERTLSDRSTTVTAKRELLSTSALRQGHRDHRSAGDPGRRSAPQAAGRDASTNCRRSPQPSAISAVAHVRSAAPLSMRRRRSGSPLPWPVPTGSL